MNIGEACFRVGQYLFQSTQVTRNGYWPFLLREEKNNMKNEIKRQIEAKISEAITKFKIEHIGKEPREVRSYIIDDIVVVRLKGALTTFEKQLVKNSEGARIIKLGRIYILERSGDVIDKLLQDLLNISVKHSYMDVNPQNGDMFIVFELSEDIASKILKYGKSA